MTWTKLALPPQDAPTSLQEERPRLSRATRTHVFLNGTPTLIEDLTGDQTADALHAHVRQPHYDPDIAAVLAVHLEEARRLERRMAPPPPPPSAAKNAIPAEPWPPTKERMQALALAGHTVVSIARLCSTAKHRLTSDAVRALLESWHTSLKELKEEAQRRPHAEATELVSTSPDPTPIE